MNTVTSKGYYCVVVGEQKNGARTPEKIWQSHLHGRHEARDGYWYARKRNHYATAHERDGLYIKVRKACLLTDAPNWIHRVPCMVCGNMVPAGWGPVMCADCASKRP